MNRLHRGVRIIALSAVLTGSMAASMAPSVLAQEQAPDVALRSSLAAITLDQETLPNGYSFVGEAFLTADQTASGSVDAKALTDAGFLTGYVSVYENSSDNSRIRSYVSAWKDDASAQKGFDLLENETATNPDAALTDADTTVGETPHELTTGTYKEGDSDIGTADLTFRSGSMLVGVAVEKTDGTEADKATAESLAKTSAARATDVASGKNPQFTDLKLPAQALPLQSLGTEVQAGFISPAEAESIYNLQGSALTKLTASWTSTIGVGNGDDKVPFVTVSVTAFGSADEAKSVVTQAADLVGTLPNGKAIDGAKVDGADATAAFSFTSVATGGDAANSYRILSSKGSSLITIDVQGAPSEDLAQQTAESLAQDQLGCLGQNECAAPKLPDGLAG